MTKVGDLTVTIKASSNLTTKAIAESGKRFNKVVGTVPGYIVYLEPHTSRMLKLAQMAQDRARRERKQRPKAR